MVRKRMQPPPKSLAEFVDRYLTRHDLSANQFGKRIGKGSNSTVSYVRRGERPIKEKEISKWIEAMRLFGVEKEQFLELAHVALADDWLQKQYWRLKTVNELNEKAIDALEVRIKELEEDCEDDN